MQLTTTTIIADGHAVVKEGVKLLLGTISGHQFSSYDGGNSLPELIHNCEKHTPDLVIFDVNLSGIQEAGGAKHILKRLPNCPLVLFSQYNSNRLVDDFLQQGIAAFLHKSIDKKVFRQAIQRVLAGERGVVHRPVVAAATQKSKAMTSFPVWDQSEIKYRLTPRELEILSWISNGLSNKEIGTRLYISDQTVSVHRKNIMRKLGVSKTATLVRLAVDHNLC